MGYDIARGTEGCVDGRGITKGASIVVGCCARREVEESRKDAAGEKEKRKIAIEAKYRTAVWDGVLEEGEEEGRISMFIYSYREY